MKSKLLLLIFFFIGCNSQPSIIPRSEKLPKVETLKTKLLGRWGGLGERRPVWEIKIDSIYYFQELKSYPYQILNNNFVIYRQESKGILRNISVIKDTMTFYDEQGMEIKGYRFKDK